MINQILNNDNDIITTSLDQITEEEGYQMITNIHCELKKIDTNNIQLSRAVMALYVDFASPSKVYLWISGNNRRYLIDGFQGKAKDNYLYVDITDELQDALNSGKNYIDMYFDGYTNSSEDCYYTFNDSLNKLYLEYSSKNDENENSVFLETPSTLAGSGKVNLATGSLTFGFNDTTLGNSTLPIVVSHHYNQNYAGKNDFNCGYGWKLNAQQYLKQNEVNSSFVDKVNTAYTWIDAEGKEIAFLEKFYYLNDKKEKVYVDATNIQLNADGSYTMEDGTVLTKECVSDGGLILEAEPKNIKNKDLFYTATEEIASLEQRLKSINDSIKQINDNKIAIDKSYVNSLNSIVLQIRQKAAEYSLKELGGDSVFDDERKTKAYELISSLNDFNRISFTVDMDSSSVISKTIDLIDKIGNAHIKANSFYSLVINNLIYSLETKLNTLCVFFESIENSLSITNEQYNEQSKILTNQAEEYDNLKTQCEEQLKYCRQNQPTYFIKDGDLVYGFGDATKDNLMRLILVIDKFENYITYSYDRADKLVQITSSNGESVVLNYENDLLKTITDSNGKTISYNYYNKYLKNTFCDYVYNYFDYNDKYCLIGAINSSDLLGVGFEYTNDRVTGMCSLQKIKSISNGNIISLSSSEIADKDAFTLSYTKYKKHNSLSINYYDYKSVIVTDNTTGKSVTYLFDNGGNLVSKYENSFENALSGQHTKGVAYQRTGNKVNYSASQNEFADELTSDATVTFNRFTASKENPAIAKKSFDYGIEGATIVKTLSASAIQKIKDSKEECFVLSGWAKADSLFINTYNSNTLESGASDFSKKLNQLLLSSNNNISKRKFELRAEITFQSGTNTYSISYKTSFDWMNDNWQYCALPITSWIYNKNQIKEIKLIFDYSYNVTEAQFFGMSLKAGKWRKNTYNDKGKIDFSETSDSNFWTSYSHNKDDKLSFVVNGASLPDTEEDTEFATSYYYNGQGALVKIVDMGNPNKDGDQIVTEYVYDNKGNIVKEMVYNEDEPANKFITEYVTNEDGSSTQSVDALGNKTFSSYDKQGNLTEQTDALGNKVAFGYEKNFGGLANITASVNGETSSNENIYKYGLLVKTKHNGCEYEFDYDGLGRKTAVRINGEPYCTIAYEGNDTQTVTYASGERVKKEILNDGRMCDVFYAKNGETLKEPTIYEYDKTPVDTQKDKLSYKEYIEDRTNVDFSKIDYTLPNITNQVPHVKYKTYYDKKDRVAKTEIADNGFGDFGDKLRINNTYGFNDSLVEQRVQIGDDSFVEKEKRSYEYGLKNKLTSINHEGAFTESPTLDKLGRVSTIQKGGLTKQFNYYQNGERATTLVASETFSENNITADKLSYTYDKKGNISEIRENGELVARYEYDSLNRLVREDNRPLNKSFFMSYDTAGNIVEKKESVFTLGLSDTAEKTVSGTYVYADKGNKDQLLSFNDEAIEYDVLGNPTIYRDYSLSWSHINRLAGVGDNIGYKYNYAGIRLFKTVGDKTTKYYCDGAKVIAQDDGTDMLYFYYGTEGVTAFKLMNKYSTKVYHYKKDMLGNILGIYDANGQLLVKYVYDAWGNHKTFVLENNLWVDISGRTAYTESDSTATKVAILNPFRYRSYYYDIETGLYYLQSRYYDPETGRFISPDNISYLDPEIIGGLNLYSYCLNNPVMYIDPTGHLPFFILTALIGAVIGVGITAAVDYIPDQKFDLHWGWYVGAGVLGAVIGAGIGMAVSYYATGSITSSTGKVFSGLFGKTTLYRSVGPDELADIQKTSKFNLGNGMESKQFGLSLDETRMFGNHPLINQPNIVGAKIPNRILYRLDFTPVDVGIFKSGIVTVQSSMLNTFNNSLLGIMFL